MTGRGQQISISDFTEKSCVTVSWTEGAIERHFTSLISAHEEAENEEEESTQLLVSHVLKLPQKEVSEALHQ